MKKSNAFQEFKKRFIRRWSDEDYPGATPRFQLGLLAKDFAVFVVIPLSAVVSFKMIEASMTAPKKGQERKRPDQQGQRAEVRSQVISFKSGSTAAGNYLFPKRAPGTLVKVRLMNVVETFSAAPVHAQIVDETLGHEFLGGTIVGDATSEANSGRIKIDFKFVRHPKRSDIAVPITARAMSLDGTFGVAGAKKEGVFARAAARSASSNPTSIDAGSDKQDLKTMIARAFAAGMLQEFESDATVAHNNAQVWTLRPMTEFYVELTDYFPGQK